MKVALFVLGLAYASAYVHVGKENILTGIELKELEDRMRKEFDMSYLDIANNNLNNLLGARSLEEEQYPLDYDLGDTPLHPSIRDQEYLRHSTLWGSKFAGDGSVGTDNQRVKPQNPFVGDGKSKNSLPAYCNPPNPCPVGHEETEGCLKNFENTAAFSRRFQDEQDCMCDTEHMFDCPDNTDPFVDDSIDTLNRYEFNQFVRQQVQKDFSNPFLSGERLPVAAKKGNRVF